MINSSTKKIALNGLMIALVFLATYIVQIPIASGYVNLGDSMIMITAIILGRSSGMISGAIGSCLADMAGGYFIYAPVTFIVKGIEGLVVALIAYRKTNGINDSKKGSYIVRLVGVAAGALVMVAGYFFAESFLLGFFGSGFGTATAIKDVLPNLMQGAVTAVIGYGISALLIKTGVKKYL